MPIPNALTTAKTAALCGVALTLFAASLTLARADFCGDFRAAAGLFASEAGRVTKETRTQQNYAQYCADWGQLGAQAKLMLNQVNANPNAYAACFQTQDKFALYRTSLMQMVEAAAKVDKGAGCPH